MKIGTLYLQAVAGLFDGPAGPRRRVPVGARPGGAARGAPRPRRPRAPRPARRERRRARAPADLLEAFYAALERDRGRRGPADARAPSGRRSTAPRPSSASSSRCRTPPSRAARSRPTPPYTLAVAGREEAERRLAAHAPTARRARAVGHVPHRRGAGRLPRRLRPRARRGHRAVRARRRRHDAGHPGRRAGGGGAPRRGVPRRGRGEGGGEATARPALTARGRRLAREAARGRASRRTRRRCCASRRSSRRSASLVPQTRVRIRATGSVNYGRSIPTYPEEWGGGHDAPRQPRPARRVARGRHAPARHRLQPRRARRSACRP